MNESPRQIGRTSAQMNEAKFGALFVWCTNDLQYPRLIMEGLRRYDLILVSPQNLYRFRGRTFSEVIIDHATHLNSDQQKILAGINTRELT